MPKEEIEMAIHNAPCNGPMEVVKDEVMLLCMACGEKVPFAEAKEKATVSRIKILG